MNSNILTQIKSFSLNIEINSQREFIKKFTEFYNLYKGKVINHRLIVNYFYLFKFNSLIFANLEKLCLKLGILLYKNDRRCLERSNLSSFSSMAYDCYIYDVLTADEQLELIKKAQNGDFGARDKLVNHSLRLPFYVLRFMNCYTNKKEDLIQIGNIAIVDSIYTFDFKYGITFASYAITCIKNAICNYIKKNIIPRFHPSVHSQIRKLKFNEICYLYNNYMDNYYLKYSLESLGVRNTYMKEDIIDIIESQLVCIYSIEGDFELLSGEYIDNAEPSSTNDIDFYYSYEKLKEDLVYICSYLKDDICREIYYHAKGINGYSKLSIKQICEKYNCNVSKINNIEKRVNELILNEKKINIRQDWENYLSLRRRTYERL